MQTFLPYPSAAESARVLDSVRLGRQRTEIHQVLEVLTGNRLVWTSRRCGYSGPDTGSYWHLEARRSNRGSHDPAVLMWNGHIQALLAYQRATCAEWTARGHRDTWWERSSLLVEVSGFSPGPISLPSWWGSQRLHAAHRGSLLIQEPGWYGRFGWTDSLDPEGLWPATPTST